MIYATILSGGKGSRMGNTNIPKQFLNIGDKPIIIHTLEVFLLNSRIDAIIIATVKEWKEHTLNILNKYIKDKKILQKIHICEGGSDRNKSIIKSIEYIESYFGIKNDDVIITHDAVRPFVTQRIINENIDMAIEYGATDTVIPSFDTIVKSEDGNFISDIPIRDFMYQGQTPQTFNINKLYKLYNLLSESDKSILTDAAKIFFINNQKIKLVRGELFNIKITTPYDLKIANTLLNGEFYDK